MSDTDNNLETNEVFENLADDTKTDNENVIASGAGRSTATVKPAITPVGDGVIGSGKTPVAKKADVKPAKPSTKKVNKVAIFSNRNLVWQGVGKIVKGYNFVDGLEADQWLTKEGVRKASPEEVKAALG